MSAWGAYLNYFGKCVKNLYGKIMFHFQKLYRKVKISVWIILSLHFRLGRNNFHDYP